MSHSQKTTLPQWQTLLELALPLTTSNERLTLATIAASLEELALPAPLLGRLRDAVGEALLVARQSSARPEAGQGSAAAGLAGADIPAQVRVRILAPQVPLPEKGWGLFLVKRIAHQQPAAPEPGPVPLEKHPDNQPPHTVDIYLYQEGAG